MKNLSVLCLTLVVALATINTASADKPLKSGPQDGDKLGAFYVTKIAGAENDGVDEGRNLCYRCRNGQRPQVIVFTRSTDAKVTELVKQLDKAVTKNDESSLRVFVNLLGDDKDDLAKSAKKFATSTETTNIPFVVPNEFENGPDNYGINAKAEVTVLFASDLGVKASHAVAHAKDLNIDKIVASISRIIE